MYSHPSIVKVQHSTSLCTNDKGKHITWLKMVLPPLLFKNFHGKNIFENFPP